MSKYEIFWQHLWQEYDAGDTVEGSFEELQSFVTGAVDDLIGRLTAFRDDVQQAKDIEEIEELWGKAVEEIEDEDEPAQTEESSS
jgi:hypothetical protein